MINLIDFFIIAIALFAALGAVLLLRPQVESRDAHEIRKLRAYAEKDRELIAEQLNQLQKSGAEAEGLKSKLSAQKEAIAEHAHQSETSMVEVETLLDKVRTTEVELTDISNGLSDRIKEVQAFCDQQLTSSQGTISGLRSKLDGGMIQLDEAMRRLSEHERVAQEYSEKIATFQANNTQMQEDNNSLCEAVNIQMMEMIDDSSKHLSKLDINQNEADQRYEAFAHMLEDLEARAQDQFFAVFQSLDSARQELDAGLKESRGQLQELDQQTKTVAEQSEVITQQYNLVADLPTERLSKTVELADEVCVDLEIGLKNARHLLDTLNTKTAQVIREVERGQKKPKARVLGNSSAASPKGDGNLFAMRAYR